MNNFFLFKTFFFFFVGVPLQNHPQGDTCATGGEPLPSPPPWGWSQGFWITPRTVGRIPLCLLYPAFSIEV